MPIQPVNRMEPLPFEGPDDVVVLLDHLRTAGHDGNVRRGLADHFAYLAGVHPQWLRPYQEVIIAELYDRFDEVCFDDQCVLLADAPDVCVDTIVQRLRRERRFADAWMLAAIGTPAALAAVAQDVRDGADRSLYEDVGVWVPAIGPAEYRFSAHRRAIWVEPLCDGMDLSDVDHPIGLALSEVAGDTDSPVVWHYLSISVAAVAGMPAWPTTRVHLVSPRQDCRWTLTGRIDQHGRYVHASVDVTDPTPAEMEERLRESEREGGRLAQAQLRPYDADLVYCNGHILSTPNVVGTAGGPPIGLYPNPYCPGCGRLMFHVVTVQNYIREYGDGWRSLFLCEDCRTVAVNATAWN